MSKHQINTEMEVAAESPHEDVLHTIYAVIFN